jgi:hypothetical protein
MSPIGKVLAGLEVIDLPVCINQGNTLNLNARREALPFQSGRPSFLFSVEEFCLKSFATFITVCRA